MNTIANLTRGQCEGWIIRLYFSGEIEKKLIPYAEYWINRLGLAKESIIQ